ncbi:MAG: hypothetical protein ABSC25_23415, partial [Roseiarcus sp.]
MFEDIPGKTTLVPGIHRPGDAFRVVAGKRHGAHLPHSHQSERHQKVGQGVGGAAQSATLVVAHLENAALAFNPVGGDIEIVNNAGISTAGAPIDRGAVNFNALSGANPSNCSGRLRHGYAAHGIGRPSRVRRIASMARIDRRRAVSTTD